MKIYSLNRKCFLSFLVITTILSITSEAGPTGSPEPENSPATDTDITASAKPKDPVSVAKPSTIPVESESTEETAQSKKYEQMTTGDTKELEQTTRPVIIKEKPKRPGETAGSKNGTATHAVPEKKEEKPKPKEEAGSKNNTKTSKVTVKSETKKEMQKQTTQPMISTAMLTKEILLTTKIKELKQTTGKLNIIPDETTNTIPTAKNSIREPADNKVPSLDSKKYANPPSENIDNGNSSSFMAYLVIIVVFVICGYIAYHNRRKILGFIIEGKRQYRGRRSEKIQYHKLEANMQETLSAPAAPKSVKEYVY